MVCSLGIFVFLDGNERKAVAAHELGRLVHRRRRRGVVLASHQSRNQALRRSFFERTQSTSAIRAAA